jgi:hypothetical protein
MVHNNITSHVAYESEIFEIELRNSRGTQEFLASKNWVISGKSCHSILVIALIYELLSSNYFSGLALHFD